MVKLFVQCNSQGPIMLSSVSPECFLRPSLRLSIDRFSCTRVGRSLALLSAPPVQGDELVFPTSPPGLKRTPSSLPESPAASRRASSFSYDSASPGRKLPPTQIFTKGAQATTLAKITSKLPRPARSTRALSCVSLPPSRG